MGQMSERRTWIQRFLFASLQPLENAHFWFALSLTYSCKASLQSALALLAVVSSVLSSPGSSSSRVSNCFVFLKP